MYLCQVCKRTFDAAGFCPFDGKPLFAQTADGIAPDTMVDLLLDARKATTHGHVPAAAPKQAFGAVPGAVSVRGEPVGVAVPDGGAAGAAASGGVVAVSGVASGLASSSVGAAALVGPGVAVPAGGLVAITDGIPTAPASNQLPVVDANARTRTVRESSVPVVHSRPGAPAPSDHGSLEVPRLGVATVIGATSSQASGGARPVGAIASADGGANVSNVAAAVVAARAARDAARAARDSNGPTLGGVPAGTPERAPHVGNPDSGMYRLQAISAASGNQAAALATVGGPDEYDSLVGQTLDGRYRIERKIGEGGMGVVFAARHVVIERALAIKVLRREVMRDQGTLVRFEQEAKAATRIGHPNIVDVTDFGTTPDGLVYSVMEFLDGQTLSRVNRNDGPLAPARMLRVAAQLARALGAAHDKGIVHRDLKPDNVFLLTRDGRADVVKVVDFGIAKMLPLDGNVGGPRLTKVGSVFGTPEFMAPEQAQGRNDTDARVDIYALGVMMYEMVTGLLPHKGETNVRTISMQILEAPVPPRQRRPDLAIPLEIEAIILKAMAKSRDARYQTMRELHAALEVAAQTVNGPPLLASPTGNPSYALPAVPPGADAVAAGVARQVPGVGGDSYAAPSATPRPKSPSATPRPKSPSATPRPHHPSVEPAFTANQRPADFEHVFTDEPLPPARARWPWLLAPLLVAGGVGGWFALRSDHTTPAIPPVPQADASSAMPVADAALAAPRDASGDARSDAMIAVVGVQARPPLDSAVPHLRPYGPTPHAAGAPSGPVITPNGRGTHAVQVLTSPEGGALYIGTSYRGPGGTRVEDAAGATAIVRCTLPGYKEGSVAVVFDGVRETVTCAMERIKICIDGIKNPFDDCELPPGTKPQ